MRVRKHSQVNTPSEPLLPGFEVRVRVHPHLGTLSDSNLQGFEVRVRWHSHLSTLSGQFLQGLQPRVYIHLEPSIGDGWETVPKEQHGITACHFDTHVA